MAKPGREPYFFHNCDDSFFTTLKQLKEVKFGDTVCITEIKTPIVRYGVPKEVNDDRESWEAFSKIFISPNEKNLTRNALATTISYIRSDGKPEQGTLRDIFKV